MSMELTALSHRCDGWWAVAVPEVEGLFTQARRLDQVADMVKDAASLLLDQPESDFTVTVVPQLPTAEQRRVAQVKAAKVRLAEAEAETARASRAIVATLRDQGLTVRDVATILNVTPARVSQLAA
ncbi:MAG: XRE family transcriptional regulator [Propionibacteriaceae bacterium]|jgi:predicted RNase H-like HicB family nuclease|nr:XRE family transcriptional regulator [Propionibacteriaceae bacterium]